MKSSDRIIIIVSLIILAGISLGLGIFDELRPERAVVATEADPSVSESVSESVSDEGKPEWLLAAASGSSTTVKKVGLVRTENGSLYFYKNGKPVTSSLIRSGKNTYYFGKNGKAYTGKWRTVSGEKYYFGKSGKAVTGSVKIGKRFRVFDAKGHLCVTQAKKRIVRVGKKKYMVTGNGYAVRGWTEVGGRMVHTLKKGLFDNRKKAGYIPLNGKGYAKNTTQAKAKVLARRFIRRHTNPSDSAVDKFRKCFRQIIGGTAYVGDWRPQGFGKKGWQYRSAVEMLSNGLVGDCYGVSCAVAACAKELGFQPYVIWATCSHSFVIVDGKYYDNMYGAVFGATTHEPYQTKEEFKF